MKKRFKTSGPFDARRILEKNFVDTDKNFSYPIFTNPEEYIHFREWNPVFGPFKKWFEWRAIERCLKGFKDIRTVCDSACGPGRLFPYWQKKSFKVIGVDLSEPMVEAAKVKHRELNLDGCIIKGDAFHLRKYLIEKPDLAVSVRFFYYFQRKERINLLRSLSTVSKKYLLLQYKTTETIKGKRNAARSHDNLRSKKFCSYQDIIDEMREAGLACLRIEPIGETSDRVFVLSQKSDGNVPISYKTVINRRNYQKKISWVSGIAAVILMGFLIASNIQFTLDPHEREVERIVKEYQDGNDKFYVSADDDLEDLRTNDDLSVIENVDMVDDKIANDQIHLKDSFFLILEQDVDKLKNTTVWIQLSFVKKVHLGSKHFILLCTEKKRSSFEMQTPKYNPKEDLTRIFAAFC